MKRAETDYEFSSTRQALVVCGLMDAVGVEMTIGGKKQLNPDLHSTREFVGAEAAEMLAAIRREHANYQHSHDNSKFGQRDNIGDSISTAKQKLLDYLVSRFSIKIVK